MLFSQPSTHEIRKISAGNYLVGSIFSVTFELENRGRDDWLD